MNYIDLLEETYTALSANRVRSGLTMLGIVIGISSVIAMVSIGTGAQASVQSSIQSIGSNLLIIMPGAQRGPGLQVSSGRGSGQTLTVDDATSLPDQISGIAAVAPQVSGRFQVTARGTNTNTSINGVTSDYSTVRNITTESGSFISEAHMRSGARVAVLGPDTVADLFGDNASPVGQSVRINGIEFKVIGVTNAKGGSGFGSSDDVVYIPLSTAQRLLTGNEYLSNINVQATNADDMTQIQADITALLRSNHRLKDDEASDFNIMNQSDIVATASSVTGIFTVLLGGIAGISLVVGGIGIMNMMLTSVTERTREIGLRKALGAKQFDINIQFLAEATALTLIGGVIGIALGWGVAYIISATGLIQTSVTIKSVLLAFSVSAAIGIIFGYYPARRAAKLNPIEALRYE